MGRCRSGCRRCPGAKRSGRRFRRHQYVRESGLLLSSMARSVKATVVPTIRHCFSANHARRWPGVPCMLRPTLSGYRTLAACASRFSQECADGGLDARIRVRYGGMGPPLLLLHGKSADSRHVAQARPTPRSRLCRCGIRSARLWRELQAAVKSSRRSSHCARAADPGGQPDEGAGYFYQLVPVP